MILTLDENFKNVNELPEDKEYGKVDCLLTCNLDNFVINLITKSNNLKNIKETFIDCIKYCCIFSKFTSLNNKYKAKYICDVLNTHIKSDIFKIQSVEFNILNYCLIKNDINLANSYDDRYLCDNISYTIPDNFCWKKIDNFYSVRVVGCFIINYLINNNLKHCVVIYRKDNNNRNLNPIIKRISDEKYLKLKDIQNKCVEKYFQD